MKIFKNNYNYKTNDDYQEALEKINDFTRIGIDYVEPEDLSKVIFLLENCAISLRAMLEELNEEIILDYETERKAEGLCRATPTKSLEKLPVNIEKKDKIYHIQTPYTFRRGMKESFQLCTYLKGELNKKRNEGMEFNIDGKYVVCVVRVSKKFIPSRTRDNDNLETSRMINAIFGDFLGQSDNAKNMSFFSDYLNSDDENEWGFHLFLVPYSFGEFRGRNLLDLFKNWDF